MSRNIEKGNERTKLNTTYPLVYLNMGLKRGYQFLKDK
jgi:hypothetical protein